MKNCTNCRLYKLTCDTLSCVRGGYKHWEPVIQDAHEVQETEDIDGLLVAMWTQGVKEGKVVDVKVDQCCDCFWCDVVYKEEKIDGAGGYDGGIVLKERACICSVDGYCKLIDKVNYSCIEFEEKPLIKEKILN